MGPPERGWGTGFLRGTPTLVTAKRMNRGSPQVRDRCGSDIRRQNRQQEVQPPAQPRPAPKRLSCMDLDWSELVQWLDYSRVNFLLLVPREGSSFLVGKW